MEPGECLCIPDRMPHRVGSLGCIYPKPKPKEEV